MKLPCANVIPAAEDKKISSISLFHHYYQKKYIYNTYLTVVMPNYDTAQILGEVEKKIFLPSEVHQPPDRPKKIKT